MFIKYDPIRIQLEFEIKYQSIPYPESYVNELKIFAEEHKLKFHMKLKK